MLAMHPKVQQELYEEVQEVWPSTSEPVNEELLKKLTYMDLCIKETMRLFPVGAVLGRVPMAEAKLGPYTVCPGTVIIINAFLMHRRKDIWGEDAELFNPQRFTLDNSEHRHPFAYIPFSAGPRNCIGELCNECFIISIYYVCC
jgi:cytochrome P450 family 4